MKGYYAICILFIATFSTAIFQISSILQHVETSSARVESALEQFQSRFAQRRALVASSFTSLRSSEDEDDGEDAANKHTEVGWQHPRKLDLNYLQAMMELGRASNGHGVQQQKPTSKLQQMVAESRLASIAGLIPNKDFEIRREKQHDLYMGLLKKRGQCITDPETGAAKLVSYAQLLLRMPRGLKLKNFQNWTKGEKVWANVTHFPWSLDPPCNFYSIQFGINLPTVGLSSYPSSGNTWLRYLIEGATGFFTGSMYDDVAISNKGFYGEGVPYNSGMTIAIKSHGYTTEAFSKKALDKKTSITTRWAHNHIEELNKTAILLIRNPFKAIIGHRNLDEAGHTGIAGSSKFEGQGWDRFVRNKIKSWELFYSDWFKSGSKLLVVHFENLVDNLDWNLLRIIDFLGYEVQPRRIECLHRNREGHFHRQHSSAKIIHDPFSEEQKERIREAIQRLNRQLKASTNQESLPLHKYEYY